MMNRHLFKGGKKERKKEKDWIKEASEAGTLDTSHESRLWKPVAKSSPHLLALEDPRTMGVKLGVRGSRASRSD